MKVSHVCNHAWLPDLVGILVYFPVMLENLAQFPHAGARLKFHANAEEEWILHIVKRGLRILADFSQKTLLPT
eukprot:m.73632 g.73632  ORF g.73632 m.73632 type:complete len:73 (+) comp35851_c0_seq10:2069-2287(+)